MSYLQSTTEGSAYIGLTVTTVRLKQKCILDKLQLSLG